MTAVLIGRFDPGSPQWHAARANGIGGSEIAAVIGLSPFESRFSLWHRKAGTIGPVEDDPIMEWGRRLEPAVAGKFLDEHAPLLRSSTYGGTFAHPDRPWQIANPDLLLVNGNTAPEPCAVLEVKTSPFGDGWGEAGADQVPPHVRCQALWYLDVLGLQVAYVVVLIGGHDYREYRIDADPDEQAELRAAAERFLAELAAGQRPDIDEHGATYQAIREMHPDIDPEEVVLGNDLARSYIAAKACEKAAKAAAQEATSRVADAMGNAQRATWDGQVIARRQARDGGTPYVVAARDLPDTKEHAA
jgi:putative phage-type endonuclease